MKLIRGIVLVSIIALLVLIDAAFIEPNRLVVTEKKKKLIYKKMSKKKKNIL